MSTWDCSSSSIPLGIPPPGLLESDDYSLYLIISLLFACLSLKLLQSELTSFLNLMPPSFWELSLLIASSGALTGSAVRLLVNWPFYSWGDLCCYYLWINSLFITRTPFFFLFRNCCLFLRSEVSCKDAVRPRSCPLLPAVSQSISWRFFFALLVYNDAYPAAPVWVLPGDFPFGDSKFECPRFLCEEV